MNVSVAGQIITSATLGGSASVGATNAANITGLNTLNIRNVTTPVAGTTSGTNVVVATFDASSTASITAVNSNLSTGDVTVTNLATGGSIGVIGNGTLTNGATNFAYKTATAAQTINLSGGVTAGAITSTNGTGTAATINSTGAANTTGALSLAGAGGTLTSLTVNAATNLTTTLTAADFAATAALVVSGAAAAVSLTNATGFKTIDASGLTAGGLTATLGTAVTSFKGGAGNDVITTAALVATVAGEVDGGAGVNTLVLGANTDISTATKGAQYTNFQTLSNSTLAVAAATVAGITTYVVSGGGSGYSGLASTATVNVIATDAALPLAATSGTTGTLALNLGGTTAATVVSATAAVITGYSTINLGVNSGITTAVSTATPAGDILSFAATNTQVKTITATGAYDLQLNLSNATGVTTLNLAAMTAGAGVTFGANTSTLTATGSNVASYYLLGSGVINLTAGTAADIVSGSVAQVSADTINGGATGVNTLLLTGTLSTLNDATFINVTNFNKLTLSDTANQTVVTGASFNTAFAGGVTITDAAALTASSATVHNFTNYSGAVTESISAAVVVGGSIAITGSTTGVDKITIVDTGLTTGSITVTLGSATTNTVSVTAGAAVTSGTVTINDTTGIAAITVSDSQGTLTANALNTFNLGSTVSLTSGTVFNTITGYVGSAGTTQLDDALVFGTSTLNGGFAATAVSGGTTTTLAVSLSAAGMLTFTGTAVATTTAAKDAQAIAAYNSTVASLLSANNTVAFDDGTNTFVFHHTATADTMVELIGITGSTLIATNAATANTIYVH